MLSRFRHKIHKGLYAESLPASNRTLKGSMDVAKALEELRMERQLITNAIVALEKLALARPKGRGRPPAWLIQSAADRSDRTDVQSEGSHKPS